MKHTMETWRARKRNSQARVTKRNCF